MFKKTVYGKKIYYHDVAHDDFFNTKTNQNIIIDDKYLYINKNIFFLFFSFIFYYFIATPLLIFFTKFIMGVKIIDKKKIKKIKSGYIIYGNHTSYMDAFIPHVRIARFRKCHIIANKDSVSIKGVSFLVKQLGALPVSDTPSALINLSRAISYYLKQKKVIVIYPEAHIWPYYTGLRPFPVTSFRFASSNNVPVVPIASTYQTPKGLFKDYKKPKMVIYVGDPIYPKDNLSQKENAIYLRDEVYKFINEKVSKYSTCNLYDYEYKI